MIDPDIPDVDVTIDPGADTSEPVKVPTSEIFPGLADAVWRDKARREALAQSTTEEKSATADKYIPPPFKVENKQQIAPRELDIPEQFIRLPVYKKRDADSDEGGTKNPGFIDPETHLPGQLHVDEAYREGAYFELEDKGDRYKINEKKITLETGSNSGGMGFIVEGEDTKFGRPILMKCLRDIPTGIVGRQQLTALYREARLQANLEHPHIAQIYNLGILESDGKEYPGFIMEKLDGSVNKIARELNGDEIIEMLEQISGALRFSEERGVRHNDIKLENIGYKIDPETGKKIFKLIDFGLAMGTYRENKNDDIDIHELFGELGSVTAAPEYWAPTFGKGDYNFNTETANIHALATSISWLMALRDTSYTKERLEEYARRPFTDMYYPVMRTGGTLIVPESTPEEIANVLLKATEIEPENRYQTYGEFISALSDAFHESKYFGSQTPKDPKAQLENLAA